MGCKKRVSKIGKAFDPRQHVKSIKGGVSNLAKGKFGASAKAMSAGDPAFQTLKGGDQATKQYGKKALEDPYVAAGLTAAATAFGSPAAGAAVATAAGAAQAAKAKREAGEAQDALNAELQAIDSSIDDQTAALTAEDEEEQKSKVIRRRGDRFKQRSQTLLSSGLGGGSATVNRPSLLGGA